MPKTRLSKRLLTSLFIATILTSGSAQDVDGFWTTIQDRLAARDYLRVSGSLQASLRWNQLTGIPQRADPFAARLNAGLLVDLLGLQGPFAVAFSDGNTAYRLPAYAFYGFSPSYKWLQLHLGDRSLDFSPYTLNGHHFKGVGLELRPGNFYVGAMRGRLRRERAAEAGAIQNLDPVYRRVGSSVKVAFDDGQRQLAAILFHARDDAPSLALPDSARLRPQENLVLELQGKQQLGTRFDVAFNLAHSAFTRDRTAPRLRDPGPGLHGSMLGLFRPRSATAYSQAYNFSIGFHPDFAQFQLRFERLGAGYRSLGTLAFLNDTEQLSLGGSTSLLNQKVTLDARLGLQRNGLAAQATTAGTRLIGSLQLGVAVSERLTGSIALSNFNYTLRQRISTVPFVVVDSVVIVQSNLSIQLAATYLLGREKSSTLALATAYQTASTITADQVETTTDNAFFSAVASYSYSLPRRQLSITATAVANRSDFGSVRTILLSPSLALQKELVKDQWTLEAGAAYSGVRSPGGPTNRVWESRLGLAWALSKRQALRLDGTYVHNRAADPTATATTFQDWNGNLNYRLSF